MTRTMRRCSRSPAPFTSLAGIRAWVAQRFIRGEGLEIGALHQPLAIPEGAQVRYVDRMDVTELRRQYPELENEPLVPVHVVTDGETLTDVQDESQDFVVANHFLEHCRNPVLAIENMLRVVRQKGIVYLSIPDKRLTFDMSRPVTPVEHVLRDYDDGPEWSERQHYEEYVKCVEKPLNQQDHEDRVAFQMSRNYSIHYHVWSIDDITELLVVLRRDRGFPFEVELIFLNREHQEAICVLRKQRG